MMAQQTLNQMKEIRLEKVVLNMGVGKSGEINIGTAAKCRPWGLGGHITM